MGRIGRLSALCGVTFACLALVCAVGTAASMGTDPPPPKLLVGVDDDSARWLTRPDALVARQRALGLGAVRIILPWRRGQTIPSRAQQIWLHRIALTIALRQRVVLEVTGKAGQAPISERSRSDYCGFLAHVVARIPIRDVVIWNEANNPTFWPWGGAAAYEHLLATCWDSLHAVDPAVNVIDSTAPHQAPGDFLLGVGRAYRASHRQRPILDTFGHNVYPENSSEAVSAMHTNGSIDEGDYDLLVEVLTAAFAGTAQPLPGQGATRIWYLEDGFQTQLEPEKRHLYRGSETDSAPVPTAIAPSGNPADQGSQLRDAIELAYCQPFVGAFFNFELMDESRLSGWQSGLLWTDGSPKPAAELVRATIDAMAAGTVTCAAPAAG